ncbi:MAG: poly(beta-D-mannuronate) epimerase [Nevskia sp.]|nr:poly(beta-D-mannuronate) epimerase [Nevskia sp.]
MVLSLYPAQRLLPLAAMLALLCAANAAAAGSAAAHAAAQHDAPHAAGGRHAHSLDPDEAEQGDGSDQDTPDDYERAIQEIQSKPYVVDTVPSDSLTLAPPQLPDLSGYTSAALNAKIVRKPAGHAAIARMLQDNAFKAFMGGDERLREWALRQFSLPKAIYIEGGYVTPRDLARQLPKSQFEEVSAGVFVARLPIDVRPNATLHIDASVKELRLSLDRGAFLVNEGKLFITGSKVLAWNERAKTPAWFADEHDFRPFITSWGGSETYVADSSIAHLGYAASKSYGLSISQFSPGLAPMMNRPAPRGWILNSDFSDLWYGFYCYEAEDVVVRGNVYHDNIKYGIDPHDRSLRLIIAENTAYGTKVKHGIIVSREVNDSWIFDNKSYDNHLSGIVVDRNSVNNIVARNQVYRNASDGITIYESPRTLIWQNLATGNGRHGIRVRNSTEVRLYDNAAVGNNLTGIYGHIKDLADTGRNLRLDPFNLKVSMQVVGGQLVSNGSAPITIDQPLSLELYDIDLRAPRREMGIKFSGILGENQEKVLDILLRQKQAVMVKPAAAVLTGAR